MPAAPALALLEFSSIAVGTRASDALMKKAPVELVRAGSFQPGRYAVLFAGDVASVEESYIEGRRAGSAAVVDQVMLPDVDTAVSQAVLGSQGNWSADTIGIIETATLAATLQAADAAVKGAEVTILQIRLGDGLGGKGITHFGGEQADIEAAIEIGTAAIGERASHACTTIIPRFDETLRKNLSKTTRFGDKD